MLIINKAIEEAVADLDDRGEDGKPRTVNILLSLSKMDNGNVVAHVEAEAKVPKRRSSSTVAAVRIEPGTNQRRLVFQEYAPEDPDQRTIDEELRKQRREDHAP